MVLKELRLDRLQSWKVLELFEREIKVLKQLDHPHLPQYLDAFQIDSEADTCLYLVCSWADGESLLDKLEAGWRPDEDQVWDIARQGLELLDYLHSFNPAVIHRDLKPGNLIMGPEGEVHLVDLGSVQGVLNPDGGSTVVGTFGYMPPEQFSDQCVPASDLYALGATLVHLLTGKYPSDLPRKGMKLDYQSLLGCKPFYIQWLDKLLAPEVENRFQSAGEALTALNAESDQRLQKQSLKARDSGRFHTLARGTQLKIQIDPPLWIRGFGYPGVLGMGLLMLSLATGQLGALIGFSTGHDLTDPSILLAVFVYFLSNAGLLVSGLYLGLVRILLLRLRTLIVLQPDRFLLVHQLFWFSWKVEGTSTELLCLRRHFSLSKMANVVKVVERSELEHLGPCLLNVSESRELAGMIGEYLGAFDAKQACTLIQQTVSPKAWSLKQTIANDLQALFRLIYSVRWFFHKFLTHLVENQVTGRLKPFLRERLRWRRISTEISEQGIRIVSHPRGWKSAVLFMLISSAALCFAMFKVNDFLLEFMYHEFNNYFNIISFTFPLGFLFEFAVINLLLVRFSFEKILSSFVNTKLILSGDQFELREQIFGFERKQTVPVSEFRDLYRHGLPGRRYGNLVLYRAGGKRMTVGYQLNQADTYAYLSELSASLKAAKPELHPVFTEVMANWTRRCESWNTLYTGEPAPAST
ncbi:MAG: serine/threonine protein kinase, partial [Candidatus Sericytochromatia bacterium]